MRGRPRKTGGWIPRKLTVNMPHHEKVGTAARQEGPARPRHEYPESQQATSFATKRSAGDGYRKANRLRHEGVGTAAREEGPARPGDGYPENTNFAARKPTASSQHRRCRSVVSTSLSLPLPWVLVGLQTAGAGQIGRNLSHQPGSQAESLQETTDPGA